MDIRNMYGKILKNEIIIRHKHMIIKLSIIIILLIISILFVKKDDVDKGNSLDSSLAKEKSITKEIQETEEASIFIDISGCVNYPKVVKLNSNSRVSDAIKAAGGLTYDADISNINRAAHLSDGEKIYIPSVSDGEDLINSNNSFSNKVNINSGSASDFETLTGIGPATANKIIEYRNKYGKFKKIEDIKNVSGIGDKTFEKFKSELGI